MRRQPTTSWKDKQESEHEFCSLYLAEALLGNNEMPTSKKQSIFMNSIGRKRWPCSSSWIQERMIKKRKSRTISWQGSKSPYWDSRSRLSCRIGGRCGACAAVPGEEDLTSSSACAAERARAGEKGVVFQQETETATRKPKDPKQEQSTPGDLTVRCLHTAVSEMGELFWPCAQAYVPICPVFFFLW